MKLSSETIIDFAEFFLPFPKLLNDNLLCF
jgi:hypothetical protein